MRNKNSVNDTIVGWFPNAYPDESFYSILARFKVTVGCSDRAVIWNLFGSEKTSPSVEFLSRLSFTARRLRWTGYYTEENIIQQHSLFPIYAPFITSERRNHLKDVMKGNQGQKVQFLLGLTAKRVNKSQALRYCPRCILDDEHKFGFSYWHRLHQIRWVQVCPVHNIYLKNSPIAEVGTSREIPPHFIAADEVSAPALEPKEYEYPTEIYSKRIAEDFSWLLSNPVDIADINDVALGYRALLGEKNLTTNRSLHISSKRLTSEFKEFYPDKVLTSYDSSLPEASTNWLKGFFGNTREMQIPIRHLLLIHFLGFGVKEFFEYIAFKKKAHELSNHSQTIQKAEDIGSQKGTDRLRIFELLWSDPSISLREIGRRLNIDHKRVRQEAVHLGLPQTRSKEDAQLLEKAKLQRRSKWLYAIEKYPDLSLTELNRVIKPYTYKWLCNNDYVWLQKHKPIAIKLGRNKRMDWPEIDEETAKMVPVAAKELRALPGRPVRVIQGSILKHINRFGMFNSNRERMPKTVQALQDNVESAEHYYLRVISWAVEHYSREQVHCSKALLFDRLKLIYAKNNPKVAEAFEAAFQELTRREEEYHRVHRQRYPFSLLNWKIKSKTDNLENQ